MMNNSKHIDTFVHPIFDAQRLIKLMGADNARANSIIGILTDVIANGCTPIKEARDALVRQQPAQAAHMVHNLKGYIANLGGMRVFEIAGYLQNNLETGGERQYTQVLLTQLEQELTAFTEAAKDWLYTSKMPLIDEDGLELNEMQLQQLKLHLQENNILAFDEFESMRASLKLCLDTDSFKALNRAIDILDFEAALIYLDNLKSNLQ